MSDFFKKNIIKFLGENAVDVRTFAEIDSTNLEAKRIAKNGFNEPVLIVAEGQTAGRGRLGRNFYSPQKSGVYMSYLYTPKGNIADNVVVTSLAAVAVVRAIEKLTNLKPMIKWVNDIYIDGKKVAGILTESVVIGQNQCIIIGIGVNVATKDFPDELKNVAVSLNTEDLPREQLIAEITAGLIELIDEIEDRTFIGEYRAHSLVLNKRVVYKKGYDDCEAVAVEVTDDGYLVVQKDDGGRDVLSTGEISLKIF